MQSFSACAVGSLSNLCFHTQNNDNIFPLQCNNYGTLTLSTNNCNLSSFFKKHVNNGYPFQSMQINCTSSAKTEQVLVEDSSLSPSASSPEPDSASAKTDPKPSGNLHSWATARSCKEKGASFRCKVKGFNKGGLLVHFLTLVGFVPYPEMSPSHSCKEPTLSKQEVASRLVGSFIYVKVIEADQDKDLLVFSEKNACWSKFSGNVNVGEVYNGKVSHVDSYGAFVHLRFSGGAYHLTGLVHVSEVSWDFVQDARNVLRKGDDVRVKVLQIDREKQKMILSMKQLEEDPLFETLDKVFMEKPNGAADQYSDGTSGSLDIQPLQGLQEIINELLKEEGITGVRISRQGFEKRVVSQDLQLWLSNAPATNNSSTLLARAGRQVQEIQLTTSLDQDGIKKALQRVLERVP